VRKGCWGIIFASTIEGASGVASGGLAGRGGVDADRAVDKVGDENVSGHEGGGGCGRWWLVGKTEEEDGGVVEMGW
jgi:hypothetical protein